MKYGYLEGNAVVYDPAKDKAFEFGLGKWHPITMAEVGHKAAMLSKDEFDVMFSDLPAPPEF